MSDTTKTQLDLELTRLGKRVDELVAMVEHLREENRALLRELGFVVWLTASEEVIFDRVSRNKKRPLLQTADPRATVHELLESRRGLYEQAAQLTVDSTELKHEDAAETVMAEARKAFAW